MLFCQIQNCACNLFMVIGKVRGTGNSHVWPDTRKYERAEDGSRGSAGFPEKSRPLYSQTPEATCQSHASISINL